MTRQKGNIIGERVRKARLTASPTVTQEQLAARLQVAGFTYIDQAMISRIESRSRPVQDYELLAIAEALGVAVGWLLVAESAP
jgi:transcriptional regulator with XRE-family HTH domain